MQDAIRRHQRTTRIAIATFAMLVLAVLAAQAQAVDRISKQPGFNARAWTVTTPDADG